MKVGRDLISHVTDAVMEDARAWQQRPLDDVYPAMFLDYLVLKRSAKAAPSSAAPATWRSGSPSRASATCSGLWFQETEGARVLVQVLAELKQRGVQDILICCVDRPKGFPDAIEAIFPQTIRADVRRSPDAPQP